MEEYTSFEAIENDLKRYKLERDIAWEELKLIKNEYKENLQPMNWLSTALKLTGKYSFIAVIKKWLFRR
ncbi:hypothetical protein DFQ11_102638 [Winogradskyella epiphytica]|uniref:Uncharacterized protein n=1 Tax=Winogradskyella epiphytica TaxID=262005 RepID=A0A2V4Y0X3_9FLAO|nr:DUF6327 family protein [Winogradskyella epiphytica]PYE82058.1 hypothetical protein DFQ11_102638 [Winogradskyella epiphytica]GGW60764.1 hypothetical protein GCM10008085_10360 [Winogradskyella epiphytica]